MDQSFNRSRPYPGENRRRDAGPRGADAGPQSAGTEKCLANDCPLPGTVSDSTKGDGPWTCSPHRRAAPDQWPAISERAASVPWLWRALNRIATDGADEAFADQVSKVLRERGLEGLAIDREAENERQWAYRLRLGALGWAETGHVRSVPFGRRDWLKRAPA